MSNQILPPITKLPEKPPNTLLAHDSVVRINRSAGQELTLDNVAEFVEEPLVPAAEIFINKNIRTISSNANPESSNEAYLQLSYDDLSPDNKKLTNDLIELSKQKDPDSDSGQTIEIAPLDSQSPEKVVHIAMPLEGADPQSVEEFFTEFAEVYDDQTVRQTT